MPSCISRLWSELTGTNQLVAFDESGEVRALYPTDRDRFFAGPGAAVPTAIESRVEFQRDGDRQDHLADVAARRRALRVSRGASRSRNVKTSASRTATFSWPGR